ncbi:MAG: TIGR03086 family metal-binding protein [Actinomycetota bacterium]
MADIPDLYRRASDHFGALVHTIRDDQWGAPTPCTEWNVRDLVNHVTAEDRWVVPLLVGRTVAEVGDAYDGDVLGEDPVAAWDQAVAAAQTQFSASDAMTRPVHLSGGETPAEQYAFEMTADHTIHAWDLARGIGADETLPPELVSFVTERLMPQIKAWRDGGAFVAAVPVPDDADAQTRLLAETGRQV